MKAEKFKIRVEKLIDKIEDLIEKIPYHGDSCSESQKVCLKQALNEFSYTVNGVEESDFKKSKDY